jgi:hypothetical protein
MEKERATTERAEEGRNVTVWFPDKHVADALTRVAEELKTSASAIIFELAKQALPVIERHKKLRKIPLDGVEVNV